MSQPELRSAADHRRAFLVGVSLPGQPPLVVEEHLDELAELAVSDGLEVVGRTRQSRRSPDARTFIGRGKVEELGAAAEELGADLIVFDDDLTPGQVKNLEQMLDATVIDRSALILDIFAERARTSEARTQVELAQLNYLLPRLARRWTHLSRQVGGIGVRGGEGEKQIEADRRMVRTRIRQLTKQLAKIERSRSVQRKGRRGARVVSLAGYTNAGKSTLFNRLTRAGARVEDRLFATLDSKLRQGALDGAGSTVVFADTVGFIRKLPHHLVASFRSTLGEIARGDLVLHVIDRSHPQWQEQMEVGREVLQELGVEPADVITVFNKIDVLGNGGPPDGGGLSADGAVRVSARTGRGVEELKGEIARRLAVVRRDG
ncbi:MAG: GTPase HflX [Thermoanaerobaculia bacterium]|nr:GTPase HflX [Thermoanaerobaculia bacterium]